MVWCTGGGGGDGVMVWWCDAGGNTFDEAKEYMAERFLEVIENKKRQVYPHITCATDTDNVGKVFDACKQTILQQNLERLQLVG